MRALMVMLCSMVIVFSWTMANAKDIGEKVEGPKLLTRFNEADTDARTLFLYSEDDLKAVHVWVEGQWVAAKKEEYPHNGKKYNLYRVSDRLIPFDGQKLIVSSWTPEGDKQFKHKVEVQEAEETVLAKAELSDVTPREEYEVEKKKYDEQQARYYSDPYGFIPLLNRYRARWGLRPVMHDSSLSHQAHVNNTMGSPHAYMGSARVQNWAAGYGSASGVLNGWINSPGHNRNLLSPGIRYAGIALTGNEWTFNGR